MESAAPKIAESAPYTRAR
jgi:hypothetical protein